MAKACKYTKYFLCRHSLEWSQIKQKMKLVYNVSFMQEAQCYPLCLGIEYPCPRASYDLHNVILSLIGAI